MDYDEAVRMIEGMGAAQGAMIELDMDQAVSKTKMPRQYTADEIGRLLRKLDELTTGVAQEEPEHEEKRHRGLGMPHIAFPTEALTANAKKDLNMAASELKGALSGLGKGVSQVKMPKSPQQAQKSIMVSLSLQDQVSELEKIGMGMGSNSFTKDEIGIIRQELDALSRSVVKEEPKDEFQRNLTDIRNKRLIEVMQMLKASS
ncbi:MAG: hypothetical protein KGH69_00755 [Candidatus Micrarchaeota archaeon]|nr:hypothetical protein [Candidatus Micrarchaeota archaeon]